jgi:hypothetical protein
MANRSSRARRDAADANAVKNELRPAGSFFQPGVGFDRKCDARPCHNLAADLGHGFGPRAVDVIEGELADPEGGVRVGKPVDQQRRAHAAAADQSDFQRHASLVYRVVSSLDKSAGLPRGRGSI